MKLPATFGYATRVWLTSVIAPPTVIVVWEYVENLLENGVFGDAFPPDSWVLAGVLLLVGGLLSVPSWVLLIWIAESVCELGWGEWKKKWLLFGVGSVLTLLPFVILSGGDFSEIFQSMLGFFVPSYWVAISFGIFFYRLPVVDEGNAEPNEEI